MLISNAHNLVLQELKRNEQALVVLSAELHEQQTCFKDISVQISHMLGIEFKFPDIKFEFPDLLRELSQLSLHHTALVQCVSPEKQLTKVLHSQSDPVQ